MSPWFFTLFSQFCNFFKKYVFFKIFSGRLYVIGMVQFESLVDLVTYYEKHPLYRKVCLKLPVNEELLSRSRNGAMLQDDDYIPETGYADPTTSTTRARALYDYTAQRDDELTLVKNCIVLNIQKKGKLSGFLQKNHRIIFPGYS